MYCFSALVLAAVWGWIIIGWVFVLMPTLFLIVTLFSSFGPITAALTEYLPIREGKSWNAMFAIVIILIGLA